MNHFSEAETPRRPLRTEELFDEALQLKERAEKAKAEVERLREELAAWDYGTRAKREQERAEKAEAEVARLREQLTRVLEIAEKFRFYTKSYEWLSMKDELDKIKAEHEARPAAAPGEACKHETQNLMFLGSHWHWCSRCGAVQRLVKLKPLGNWQVPATAELMREFIDFMDNSLGNTADWPMEANFDNENDSDKFCSYLNAMKRIVNPLAITL